LLREQGVGSSNLPAPTITLNDLAKSLFSLAADIAAETQLFAMQQHERHGFPMGKGAAAHGTQEAAPARHCAVDETGACRSMTQDDLPA
jgi:hypothetical protein